MTPALLVVLLLVVGLVLLAIEVFVIPGVGLVGLLGGAAVVGAVAVAWATLGAAHGLLALGAGVCAAGLLFWAFAGTRAGQKMVLRETQRSGRGPDARLAALAGKEGRALTPLRPAGTVEIDDRAVDVVTDGLYVEAGTPVRVSSVEGNRVVVEPRKP
ncbi:NfeD family protein [Sorangium sp. So ce1153]|uniref:NfeD family protein n=1 Tax=Sorangium sp. So ce1153 TaxID=3133333 RepID=UPI003F63EEBC